MFRRIVAMFLVAVPLGLAGCSDESDPVAELGGIDGTVTESAGGTAIAGATVTTEPATVTVTTDTAGKYAITDVEPGTYKIVFAAAGYVTKERLGVIVREGASTRVDVPLDPATGSISVVLTDLCEHGEAFTLSREGEADLDTDLSGTALIDSLLPGEYTFEVHAAGYFSQARTVTVVAGDTVDLLADMKCHRLAVAEAARTYLTTATATTSAKAVYDLVGDGGVTAPNTDLTDDPVIISVRGAADYAKGHVPGAVNVPWKTVADDASLATLGEPVAGKKYVDYCYTGHTGAIAAAVLNLLGYPTSNMKFGIVSWTANANVRTDWGVEPVPPQIADVDADPYMVNGVAYETGANPATGDFDPPWLTLDGAVTERDAVKLAARSYLATAVPTITAAQLAADINAGKNTPDDPTDDPFVISVRSATHFETAGHIPGAINIPWQQIALEENLRKIPTDRPIVVYCYTGHTGGIATGVLGTLGYHDVRNLKYGIMAWNGRASVRVIAPFDPAAEVHSGSIVNWAHEGSEVYVE